jgi:N-acetylmuramoyl-L-alanine amidase
MNIVIDPGHGGSDPGAVNGVYQEKNLALEFALMLGHFLRKYGYKTKFTRDTDETLEPKFRRTLAREGDILISCHLNSVASKVPQGASVWYRGNFPESKKLAWIVEDTINETALLKRYSTGIIADTSRYKTGFYMLRYPQKLKCKSCILVEIGFISNPHDLSIMLKDRTRNLLAKAVADGVHSYLSGD